MVVTSEMSESAGDRVFVSEVATGQLVRTIQVKNTWGNVAALSPDGRMVATCQSPIGRPDRDYDFSTIHLWDVENAGEVLRFHTGSSAVNKLAFSSDGQALIAGMNNATALIWRLQNIKPRPAKTVAPQDLEALWADLGGQNGAKAHQAIWTLTAAPKQSVPFLRDRLKAVVLADQDNIQRWIAELSSDKFVVRQAAAKELEKVGQQVGPPIQKALKENLSLETRRRLEQILTIFDLPGTETLRTIRAVMVLERIGSSEAIGVLETLARGAPGARETEEAKGSLRHHVQR
jgi:hypothetical protein